MNLPMLRSVLLALPLLVAVPTVAAADRAALEEGFSAMAEARTEEAFYAAAQAVIDLGPAIVPDLTERLVNADDDEERIDLTFLLASILGQTEFAREEVELPPELAPAVAALLLEPRDIALEGNLANLAARFDPQPPEITEGLLALLGRAEHLGLRATTGAVIVIHGEEHALALVQDALRASEDDRFSGDLANLLRGTELPDDVVGILQDLLASDDAEARQAAARTLREAGIEGGGLLEAALRDLEEAGTDMELLNAAMAVRQHTDGSDRVAEALEAALPKARRVEERMEILRALAATGEAGHLRLYAIVEATQDAELFGQLVLGLNATSARDDPRTLDTLLSIAVGSDDEEIAEAAARGLLRHGEAARTAIEAAVAEPGLQPRVRERLERTLGQLRG